MQNLKRGVTALLITAGLLGPTLFTTASAQSRSPVPQTTTNGILYDCGQGFLQSEKCSDNDPTAKSVLPNTAMVISGYDKTYRCSNGWQVTHPSYCPDSGKNNVGLS